MASVVRCARLVSQAAAAGVSVETVAFVLRVAGRVEAARAAGVAVDAEMAGDADGIAELPPSKMANPPTTAAPASIALA